jgi:methylated-DNA-[protein]-cysteine S-methyltransferase
LIGFVTYEPSPIGILKITGSDDGIDSILFTEAMGVSLFADHPLAIESRAELREYFHGERMEFTIPLAPQGTMFQQMVWNELAKIPFGKKRTYNDIANAVGSAKMIRAVGSANARNPIAIVIPCHRVIGSDGSLTGYAGGLWRKEWLLEHEASKYSPQLFAC